jgi:hypothetical protein
MASGGPAEAGAGADGCGTRPAGPLVAAGEDLAGPCAAVEDRAGLRGRPVKQGGGRQPERDAGHGQPVAGQVHRRPPGRTGRRAAAGAAALDPAGQGRGRCDGHAGGHAEGRHALVAGLDGPTERPVGINDRRIWRKFELKPHRADGFKLSATPLFIEGRDVAGLYHNPPEQAMVLCVDEKSGMQALDRSSRYCR